MTIIDKIKDLLRMLAENIHKRRKVVLALSCVVVFVTTYMLILPAFTLEKTKAAEQGGIDVPGVTATAEDVSEEEADANDGQADVQDVQSESGKTEDGKAEDSGSKSKDSGEAKADSAQTEDPLTYEDEHYTIAVDDKNSVLPENTEIKVEEIDKNEDAKKYQKHFDDALAAIQEEKDGENVSDLEFARFYDISLVSDGKEVTLGSGDKVSVNIEYDKELRKALGVENKDNIRIIHFAENKDTGKVEAEVLDNKEAKVEVNTDSKDQLKETSFEAESFSVYAVVYTVDFEYEDEATHEVFRYSMEGGSSITLRKLAVILGITTKADADEFIANVEDVKFSDESLVKVEKTDNGWTLNSLKAFDTTETLTITMKDGSVYEVKVTDDQSSNLADFITDASLDINGTIYGKNEEWNVREGENYALKLNFKESGTLQFPKGGDEMVMNLKSLGGMTLVPGMSGTFDMPMGLYGTVTGNTWWVDNDGILHVKFGPDPDDLITRSNKSHFEIEMFVKFSGTEGKVEFNDHVESEWKADTSTDVDISKTGHYDSSTGKMVYSVTVTATGNPTNVKVTDTFASSNLLTLDQNSITISPNKELAESGNSTSSTGFTRVFKEMSHGETVTISYTADVNEEALGANGKVTGDDGKNSITVEDDQGDGDHDQNIVNEIKFSDLSKIAVSSTELSGNKVQLDWKIIANEGKKSSLVGSTISDRIDWNSREVMKYQATDGKVTIHVIGTDANDTTYEKDVPLTVADNSGQESWSWKVENIGEPEGTPLTYEITYSTIATKQNDSVSVKNEANNTGGGSGTGIGVVPGTGGSSTIVTKKEATTVTEDYVDWTIVVNVPAEGFDSLIVEDTLPGAWLLENHFGKDTIENPVRDGDIHVAGLNPDEDYQIIYDEKSGQNTNATLKLEFKKSDGTSGLDDGNARTITITVRTKNDPVWIKQVAEGYSARSAHINNAKVNGVDVKATATPVKRTISKKLTGKDTNSAGLPRYQYEVIISGITDASDFDFTDTFDSKYLQLVDPATYQTTSPVFTIGGNDLPWQWNYNGSYIQTEEIEPGKVHFYANTIPVKEDGSVYGYYKINYYLEVKDETALKQLEEQAFANGGKYELKNTVVWDSNPSEAIVEYEVKPVTKEGYFASSDSKERKYNFVIDANPQRFELGENPVELTDEHTDNLSVDYSSVKVYKIPDNVNLGDAKTAARNNQLRAEWLCSSNEVPWNFNGNEGTFSLADKTHYVITYSAVVIGSKSQTFENIADLNGFISSKKETRDYGSDSSGGGEIWEIKLLKYKDGLTSHGLQGATFQLFRGTGVYTQVSDDQGNTWYEEEKEPMKYGDTAATRATGKVGDNITFTTAADGTVTIKLDQVNDGNEIEGGVHYFLKEIDSPAGYQIDSSTEYWAFTLTTDPDEVNYGDPNRRDEYGNRQWIYFYYNDILKMANTETTNPLDVVVNKHWFDKNGNPITGDNLDESYVAEVQLMRKTDNGAYVPIKVTGYDAEGNPIIEEGSGLTQLTKDNNWSYTWSKLPRVQMGGDKGLEIIHQYAYKINEVNVQGYVVSMTETENETVKTYALNNYKTPDESDTDITVNKSWVDSNGSSIDGTAEKLPGEIQFQLYRVVSTTPFDKEPTSGGSLYVINGDSRLVNPSAVVGNDDYGVYRLQKADNWTTTFADLPKVVNENGKTYYYAYYVKEIPMEGYTTTYVVDGETRTIVNREPLPEGEYIDIGLEKKWTDGTTNTPPEGASATFTLHQQKSTKSGSESTGSISVKYNGNIMCKCNPGDTISVKVEGTTSNGYNPVVNENWIGWSTSNEFEYTVPSDFDKTEIEVRIANNAAVSVSSITNKSVPEPTYSDYEDVESFNRTITLPTTTGSWSTVIKDLVQEDENGNRYQYYLTEESCTPEPILTVYKDDLGKDSSHAISTKDQKVEVTNTYETPQTGALKINKAVKFNGNNPSTDTEKALVNKTFTFTITDSNGNPITSGKINGETITDGTVTVTVNNGLSSEVVVTDLEAGEYYIEEIDSAGLNLTEATGGTAVTDNKVKVIVTAGDTTASQSSAQASFTNNLVKVDVGILKVDGANKEPLEGAKFSLLRADSATGTYTIVTEIEGVTLDNNHWFTVPEAGVTLCNLTPGYYKIQEEVAPENYVIKERTPIVFVVEENGSLTNNSIADVEYIEDSKLFKVPNEFATELPMTGGIGTVIFYVLGSILVIGGGIYFISRRRAMK